MMTRRSEMSERAIAELEDRIAERAAIREHQCCDKRCPTPEDHYYATNAMSTAR